jgi:hypothetical protein
LLYIRAQRIVGEFPPRQKAARFKVDQVLAKLQKGGGSD